MRSNMQYYDLVQTCRAIPTMLGVHRTQSAMDIAAQPRLARSEKIMAKTKRIDGRHGRKACSASMVLRRCQLSSWWASVCRDQLSCELPRLPL